MMAELYRIHKVGMCCVSGVGGTCESVRQRTLVTKAGLESHEL
jgi:hypothetical protein